MLREETDCRLSIRIGERNRDRTAERNGVMKQLCDSHQLPKEGKGGWRLESVLYACYWQRRKSVVHSVRRQGYSKLLYLIDMKGLSHLLYRITILETQLNHTQLPYPSISQSMHFHYSHLSNMKYAKQTKPFTNLPECQLNLPASHEYSHTRFIRIQTQTRRRVTHSSFTQLLEASEKSS